MTTVALIGGPYDGQRVDLSATPLRIAVGRVIYTRIDDPDTGECLGGYWAPIPPVRTGMPRAVSSR